MYPAVPIFILCADVCAEEQREQAAIEAGEAAGGDEEEEAPEQKGTWVQPDDPNKPKRACSAYLFFTTTRRAEIAAEQPELVKNVPEMAKTLGKEWKELDEEGRKPFVARAEKDHARYQAEMKDYKPPEKVLKMDEEIWILPKDDTKPKRPGSAYTVFCSEVMPKYRGQGLKAAAQQCSTEWAAMSEDKKAKYTKVAEAAWEKYRKKMETYVPPPLERIRNPTDKQKKKFAKQIRKAPGKRKREELVAAAAAAANGGAEAGTEGGSAVSVSRTITAEPRAPPARLTVPARTGRDGGTGGTQGRGGGGGGLPAGEGSQGADRDPRCAGGEEAGAAAQEGRGLCQARAIRVQFLRR